MSDQIIGLQAWLTTATGRYALAWEQAVVDAAVADLFGYHALQLGLGPLDGLRANRMPHRWLAEAGVDEARYGSAKTCVDRAGAAAVGLVEPRAAVSELAPSDASAEPGGGEAAGPTADVWCEFAALPFPAASIDLVLLPHALEFSDEAHETLREVERVLVPEGKVVIVGFNPYSLWGLRRLWQRVGRRLGLPQGGLPRVSESLSVRRLRDWLRLLGFEVEHCHFGCYRPAMDSGPWLQRWAWLDRLGQRWWPILGGAYVLVATKRVAGLRMTKVVRQRARFRTPATVPMASRPVRREGDAGLWDDRRP